MNTLFTVIFFTILPLSCTTTSENKELREKIINDQYIPFVKSKAIEIVTKGFNAGDGYGEVWIRDYNTFIELSSKVYDKNTLKQNLLVFFRMQGEDGNIIDGFIPKDKAVKTEGGYDYIFSDLEPRYAGHKNTVETDQESSLIQAIMKYVKIRGDKYFLNEEVDGITITGRMERALLFLMNYRFNEKYGLIWGATTADWGDVQPEHDWGVFLTDDTHYSFDIYDNAMFIIAISSFIEMAPLMAPGWKPIHDSLCINTMKYLWDKEKKKFIPHIYLNGSPFPEGSGTFRGEAGVLYKAITMLEEAVGIESEK